MYATMRESNLTAHVNNSFIFFKPAYYVYNFSSVPIVFRWIFIWTALNYADLHISFTLIITANATEKETKWAAWLHHHRTHKTHVTNDVRDHFLLGTDHLVYCKATADKYGQRSSMPIGLNRKLSRKFENWCKFSDLVKAKWGEKKSHNTRSACIFYSWFISRVHFLLSSEHQFSSLQLTWRSLFTSHNMWRYVTSKISW